MSDRDQPATEPRPPHKAYVRFPVDLLARLDEYARRNYRSRSSVVIAAVARYLREEDAADGRP